MARHNRLSMLVYRKIQYIDKHYLINVISRIAFCSGGAQQGGPGGPRPPLVLGPSPINPPGPPLVFLPQVSFGNLICTVRWQSLCSFQLILMLPVTNAISEWSFSAMRRKALSAWPEKSLRETWESQKRIRNPGQLSHETHRLLSSLSGQFDIGQSL